MGEFAIGQGVSRFEDPRLIRGGGRYIDDIVLPGMALRRRAALAACARQDQVDRYHAPPRPRPACWPCITAADWKAAGFGDLPVPWRPQAPRRLADVQAALSVLAEDRVRWVGDLRRLRGGRDRGAGAGRRRTDRRSTTSRCRRSPPPPRRRSRARRASGTIAPTISASSN